jgi:deazaflavin-dependent oxidoreductase (nitroreductase family)
MDQTPSPATTTTASQDGPRARTLRWQRVVNRVLRGVLRTPLLCRLAGRRLITLYVVGRTSGRRYSVPVAYTRHDGVLLVGTPFAWGRNLRTGEAVEVRLAGRRRTADVVVVSDEEGVVRHYRLMCLDNRQFAGFNRIRLDEAGEPSPEDLRLAWSGGARVLRLSVR